MRERPLGFRILLALEPFVTFGAPALAVMLILILLGGAIYSALSQG